LTEALERDIIDLVKSRPLLKIPDVRVPRTIEACGLGD
jgi:hypothetical protein